MSPSKERNRYRRNMRTKQFVEYYQIEEAEWFLWYYQVHNFEDWLNG